ncbi:MAG TPA: hypothetical protein VJA46_13535 [Acidimicrobiia bacterium]|nr:hypothetical protein [Acidimicrobiia bacterium]
MSKSVSPTLSRDQEERLVEALRLIVEAQPVSVLTPEPPTSFWRRPMVVPVLAFLAVLAVFLPFRLADTGQGIGPTDSAAVDSPNGTGQETADPQRATGFSAADAEAMEVVGAEYPFDVEAWSATTPSATQFIAEFTEEEITSELVDLVRAIASDALAGIDAEPPYEARIISAFQTDGSWNALATASFASGECLVVVDGGVSGFRECRSTGSNPPEPILLDGNSGGFTVLPGDASFVVGDWVSVVWWGLPQQASFVRYRTTSEAAVSADSVTPVLGGTVRISTSVQGVDQLFSIAALASDDEVVMEDSVLIPSFGGAGEILETAATQVEYEMDPSGFEALVGQGESFLGGGYVNGDPWAIVGRSLVVEGKPTLECNGVRPILDEDVCDVLEGLGWMALPVGNTGGGVLVARSSEDAETIRVNYDDGTAVEAPFIGTSAGYPPVAVIPIEAPGISGTIHAITDNGAILWSQPFTVNEIVNPGG